MFVLEIRFFSVTSKFNQHILIFPYYSAHRSLAYWRSINFPYLTDLLHSNRSLIPGFFLIRQIYCKLTSHTTYHAIPIGSNSIPTESFCHRLRKILFLYAKSTNTNVLYLHLHTYIFREMWHFFLLGVSIVRRRFQAMLLSGPIQKLAWNLYRHKRLLACTEHASGIANSRVGHIIPGFPIIWTSSYFIWYWSFSRSFLPTRERTDIGNRRDTVLGLLLIEICFCW